MALHRFTVAELPVTPWKNGGGSTREIACWPPGASMADFDWRVSIATIAASGPFSVFEGVDRHIMLLEGDGVRLQSADGQIDHPLATAHQPFAFSGDAAVHCKLLGGPSSDFNVMTRRGRWRAELRVIEHATPIASAPHGLLLALRGHWRLGDSQAVLRAGQGLCWTDTPRAWQVEPETAAGALTPESHLVWVRFISDGC